jgi:hypothetical protein
LRKKAREKYIKDREGRQMDLYKKIIDEDKKLFSQGGERKKNLIDMLMADIRGEGESAMELTDIERRQ